MVSYPLCHTPIIEPTLGECSVLFAGMKIYSFVCDKLIEPIQAQCLHYQQKFHSLPLGVRHWVSAGDQRKSNIGSIIFVEYQTLTQVCVIFTPASQTVGQHYTNIGLLCRVHTSTKCQLNVVLMLPHRPRNSPYNNTTLVKHFELLG